MRSWILVERRELGLEIDCKNGVVEDLGLKPPVKCGHTTISITSWKTHPARDVGYINKFDVFRVDRELVDLMPHSEI